MVISYHLVVAQIWTSVCTTRVQCLAINRGLLAVAPLYDGFFPIEYVADEEGGTGHVALRDVDAVVLGVVSVVPHPSWTGVDAVVFFVGVAVRRQVHRDFGCALPFYFERWVNLHL